MTDMTRPMLDRDVRTGASIPWWAVYKRELGVYFRSPIAYAIAFGVLLFLGVIVSSEVTQSNGQFPANATTAPDLITFLMFLIAPLLTMRLLAEESREGTLEVLMTLPMNEGQFIIGKFLAAWTYYTVLLALTLVYYVIWSQIGTPDAGVTFSAYLGEWLYGGGVIAVCMIFSALTEDQVVAAFLGAATVLVLYLAELAGAFLANQEGSQFAAGFVRALGLQSHYQQTMLAGIIRAEDVLYFIFLMIGSLFITTRIVEIRRWRA